jgi:hypothetical protein
LTKIKINIFLDIFSLLDPDVAAPDFTNIQGGGAAAKTQHPRSAFSLIDNDPFASPTKPAAHAGFGVASPPQPPTAQPPPVQGDIRFEINYEIKQTHFFSATSGFADFANFDTALTLSSTSSHTQLPAQPPAASVAQTQQRPPPGFGQRRFYAKNMKNGSKIPLL